MPAIAGVPRYDIEGLCHHLGAGDIAGHRDSAAIVEEPASFERCLRRERNAYDAVKAVWPTLPTDLAVRYAEAARSPGASAGFGDYAVLRDLIVQGWLKTGTDESSGRDGQRK